MPPFSFITDIKGFFEIPTPAPGYFEPPPPLLPPRFLNLIKISNPLVYFDSPLFIRHLRVHYVFSSLLTYAILGQYAERIITKNRVTNVNFSRELIVIKFSGHSAILVAYIQNCIQYMSIFND